MKIRVELVRAVPRETPGYQEVAVSLTKLDALRAQVVCPECGCATAEEAEANECGCDSVVCAATKPIAVALIETAEDNDRLRRERAQVEAAITTLRNAAVTAEGLLEDALPLIEQVRAQGGLLGTMAAPRWCEAADRLFARMPRRYPNAGRPR